MEKANIPKNERHIPSGVRRLNFDIKLNTNEINKAQFDILIEK